MLQLLGAVEGGLGLLSNLSGSDSRSSGLDGGLGKLIGKFLDPLGLAGGDEESGISQEDANRIIELLEQLVELHGGESDSASECEEDSSVSDITADNWQNIFISTGSGDDTVTIG